MLVRQLIGVLADALAQVLFGLLVYAVARWTAPATQPKPTR